MTDATVSKSAFEDDCLSGNYKIKCWLSVSTPINKQYDQQQSASVLSPYSHLSVKMYKLILLFEVVSSSYLFS